MAGDQEEPKARYPRQEVADGQKHGYIGEVEVYDPVESKAGHSNVTTTKASAKDSAPAERPVAGKVGTTKSDDDDKS
jgi:hypothetical protein